MFQIHSLRCYIQSYLKSWMSKCLEIRTFLDTPGKIRQSCCCRFQSREREQNRLVQLEIFDAALSLPHKVSLLSWLSFRQNYFAKLRYLHNRYFIFNYTIVSLSLSHSFSLICLSFFSELRWNFKQSKLYMYRKKQFAETFKMHNDSN